MKLVSLLKVSPGFLCSSSHAEDGIRPSPRACGKGPERVHACRALTPGWGQRKASSTLTILAVILTLFIYVCMYMHDQPE